MIRDNEPYLIEYNVRMGDPECQTILPLLNNDLIDVIESCITGNLEKLKLDWRNERSICIVLTSKGYPEKFQKDVLIQNLDIFKNKEDQFIFHAGTKLINEKYFSNGGRVLNFVSLDQDFKKAREKSLGLIKKLNWKNGFFRKDIGYKVIENS